MSIYFNTDLSSQSADEYFNQKINHEPDLKKPISRSFMPSSDAMTMEIPKSQYKSIQPKSDTIQYPSDLPSLVKFGDYK